MNVAFAMDANSHSVKAMSRSTRELPRYAYRDENWCMSTPALRAERSMEEVGRRLGALRAALGRNQKEMCEAITVAANTWNQWEKGSRMADLAAMQRLSDLFRVDLNFIYMGWLGGLPVDLASKVIENLERTAPPPDAEITSLVLRAAERREAAKAAKEASRITPGEKKTRR